MGEPAVEEPSERAVENGKLRQTFLERIETLKSFLPPLEQDFIDLYFRVGKNQADIGQIFGMTQAAISYRLNRAIDRLHFMMSMPVVTDDELRELLKPHLPDFDVEVMVAMWRSSCQSKVAEQLLDTTGKVRHHYFKSVAVLGEVSVLHPHLRPYYSVFRSMQDNFNILHEVQLPQWAGRTNNSHH